ncbi:MAG: DUF4962 domain-containing protein, partial [bacterium]|nr:DUF4962 domain-containing protein [bacterium]
YEEYRETWEKTVLEQGHELGDHTLNHRGATTDRDSETQIGDCARHIRSIQPDNRPLAFQRGGATVWLQRKPFDFFLAKYDLFEPGRSMSCSEAYPQFSFDAFQKRLDAALENGEWMETHFHGIDETHLYISTDVFRRMLEHTAQHSADIWQTGMASAHCYQEERDGAHLFGRPNGNDAVTLHLTCATDPVRYNHPLTLELELPAGTKETTVLDAAGNSTNFQIDSSGKKQILRFNVPPETSDHTVRASGIGAAWQAANGPEWPDPGPHPYVFFTDDELPELRNKTKQAPASAMWENVKNAADHLLNEPAAPPDDPTWQDARDASNRLRILSFVHAITEDKAYALRAELEIDTILAAKSWNHLLIKADADLVSAEITCSLGLAWDWMHSALEQDRLRVIRDTIVTRGLEPIAKAAEDRVWWSYWMRGNWGAVIFGQAGVAALSILNEEPRAAEWLRLCRRKIWLYTQSLGTDGSWGESVSYACYAWSNATLLIDALHRFTGGKINLFDNLGLRRLPEWFIHLLTPDGSGFVPFSNCGKGVSFRGQYLYRLAREYGNPQAQWIAKHMAAEAPAADLFGFLWLDPDLAPEPPSSLPLAKIFSHTHFLIYNRH